MTDAAKRILLGEITGVHGIKGELIIRSYAAGNIAAYGPLADAAGQRTFEIIPIRSGPKGVVVRIVGIEDRTAAEGLRGVKLYVDRAKLPAAETNEYYVTDLIGLTAVDGEDRVIGKVSGVHNYGAGDIIEVSLDGHRTSELIPFTNAFVPRVDLSQGRATILIPVEVGEADEDQGAASKENE